MTTTIELIKWLNIESKLASGDGSPIAASRLRDSAQRLRELDAVAKEYDELIRHMDAGGDFTEFIVSKIFKEST